MGHMGGRPGSKLLPHTDEQFFVAGVDETIRFKRDGAGQVVGLVHRMGEARFTAERIENEPNVAVDPQLFKAYVRTIRV